MRSEGSRFTLGVCGWGCVRQMLRLCPQPSATVRNHPRDPREGSPQWRMHLEGFRKWVKWTCDIAVILTFAEEVSVRALCGAAVILAFAEEVSVWVICGAAFIMAFAEDISVWVICGSAVIFVLAEEGCVWVICGAAGVLAFAEEVSAWVTCGAAVILACAEESTQARVSSKSDLQECQVRVSDKSVK